MKLLLFTLIFNFYDLLAVESLKTHVHGALQMGIAVEKNEVEINIDGPAESLLGFEHAPKTAKEKQSFTEAENLWKKQLSSFVVFEPRLQCQLRESSFKHHKEGKHSDIAASAKFYCAKEISPGTVTVSLKKGYKHIKKIIVDVVSVKTQRVEITAESMVIKL